MEMQMGFSYSKHDDYEDFATRFLGVEYEDFVNLQLGYDEDSLDFDVEEVEYEVPSFV